MKDLPVRIYRIVALTIVAVLLVALVFVLTSDKGDPSVETTTTVTSIVVTSLIPSPDNPNDGVVSATERTATALGPSLGTLNRIAHATCAAVATAASRSQVRQSVLAQMLKLRPNTSPEMAAALTDGVASVACASAYGRLSE